MTLNNINIFLYYILRINSRIILLIGFIYVTADSYSFTLILENIVKSIYMILILNDQYCYIPRYTVQFIYLIILTSVCSVW